MIALILTVFILGYLMIALEHPIKVNKSGTALLIGVITWTIYVVCSSNPTESIIEQLHKQLGEIAETLFFLLGAMTIVEVVDQHNGFRVITDAIKTKNKVKLLWVVGILTFFMSAVLDNLTTTIVILALLRKLIADKSTRWFFAGMVIIAANAGGAWSPIGDVTTIMLWIGGQITAANIIKGIFIPSLVTLLVPLIYLTFTMKGEVERPELEVEKNISFTSHKEQAFVLILGISMLLMVPIFKTLTHLPPYMGMMLGLGIVWVTTEIMHRNKEDEIKTKLSVINIVRRIDVPTIFFFLGILLAVGSLSCTGVLGNFSKWLDEITNNNIYVINTVIGFLSSIVDNVPLVAGAMGMYDIASVGSFATDGAFWEMLAYCAGTGGSILIIGSAAGVTAMGLEKIDFIWYLKRISWLAILGYLCGAGVYWLEMTYLA